MPMWSGDRFVNTPTSNSIPPTRSIFSPRLETSITQASHPSSVMARKRRCKSQLSGVVQPRSCRWPGHAAPLVPTHPTRRPAAVSIAASRWAAVVLPLVPVMPTIVIRRAGKPHSRTAICASTRRALPGSTRTSAGPGGGSGSASSYTSTAAPAAAAAGAKRRPSVCCPGRQTNTHPGVTARESQQTASTARSARPRTRVQSNACKRWQSIIRHPSLSLKTCSVPLGGGDTVYYARRNHRLPLCQARLLDFCGPPCYNKAKGRWLR